MTHASRRLGELLVERKVLPRHRLEGLLAREEAEGMPLAELVIAQQLVAEKDVLAATAEMLGVAFADLAEGGLNPNLDTLLPDELSRTHQAVVVDLEGTELVVAMADPTDRQAVAAIAEATGWPIRPALALERELRAAVIARTGRTPALSEPRPAPPPPEPELHVNDLLERVVELGGSDLHLSVGIRPSVRVNGAIVPMTEFPVMNGSEVRRMVYAVLTQRQRERFEDELELDTSHSIHNLGRFRVNVFVQRDSVGAVMRVIPCDVVPFDQLALPSSVLDFAHLPRGLVLVTGPTGSGKSTTLASLIDVVNAAKPCHIMTVEDPIEFLHTSKVAIVNQREVGEDTHGFAAALKHVLRQDPDVILVGEMRDLETISTALTAAETGHLVFATLHTQDAPQSVDRIIDVFPAHQQQQVRVQLASSLQGVVTQQLVLAKGGRSRVAAAEVMVATPAIRNLIREGKTHQIYSAMQSGGKYGMQTMDTALAALVRRGTITREQAIERCANETDLRRLMTASAA